MRFWLTLVGSTVLISAGMTWLLMHQGQELVPPAATLAAKEEPGQIEFELDPRTQTAQVNVVVAKPGPSPLGEMRTVEVRFVNKGKGPLRIEYHKESCGCIDLKLDGKKLSVGSPAVVKKPGEAGMLSMSWRAEPRHLTAQADASGFRFSADLKTNDPRYTAPIKIEAWTQVQEAGKAK